MNEEVTELWLFVSDESAIVTMNKFSNFLFRRSIKFAVNSNFVLFLLMFSCVLT